MLNPSSPIIQPEACYSHGWSIRTRYDRPAHEGFGDSSSAVRMTGRRQASGANVIVN
jgi:hypothetical protein